ncbi:MAG: SUMF1/EgtB/PvdO family nonheme iron enzyme [Candidatus Coatesbacteria bacterium]
MYTPPPGGRGGLTGTVKIYDNSIAIAIGIDAYQNWNMSPLTGAVRDAVAVSEALKQHGFTVSLLCNEEASLRSIRTRLGDELRNNVGREDRVLVYFAGHGVSTGAGKRAMGYLMPVDGDRDLLRATGISMGELTEWFEEYPCKHVMFVADSCYSGLALWTRGLGLSPNLRDYLMQVTSKRVRMVMTAGRAGQEAHEWQGQGLFTRYFLEAISGAADADHDGIVTSDDIAAYVKPKVAQTAMTRFRREQNPQVGRSGEGEFVFVTEATEAAPPHAPFVSSVPATVSTEPVAPWKDLWVVPEVPAPALPGPISAASSLAKETAGQDGAEMILIPAGEFTMGSNDGGPDEKPPHAVRVSSFYLDKYEVTFDLYDRFCKATRRGVPGDGHWGRGSRPVIGVSWDNAMAYATYYGKRLPTEAEWEYACRAESMGKWCFGDDVERLGDYAWHIGNAEGQTHAVGQKVANAFGLYDMYGNVWEWCADWYDAAYYSSSPVQDPPGQDFSRYRVLRGGSWVDAGVMCRSASRGYHDPSARGVSIGFRCASSVKAQ